MPRLKLIGALAPLLIATGNPMVLAQPPHSAITATYDGTAAATVEVPLDRELEVRLGANPTTGYTWRYQSGDPARLRLKSQHFQPSGGGARPVRPGAGGTQIFAFAPIAAGTERLHFEYRRGATGSPIRTYDLTVQVVP